MLPRVMVTDEQLRKKRIYVALLAVGCLIGGAVLAAFPGHEGFQGALIRCGILLGAFWLVLPTKDRPAAWKGVSSSWILIGGLVAAIAIPRARAMFPLIAVIIGIAWFARPRK
ncbi:MAG: hypothetical protein RIK87_02885 [Fuerstiella sp.]